MTERREWRVVDDIDVWDTLTTEAEARACLERARKTCPQGRWRIESRVVGQWEKCDD